jgi:hypothetical protein
MIKTMVLKQRIAGFIWAAIFMVAVQFVPNLAYAHGGHTHQSADVAVTSPAATTASGTLSAGQQSLHQAEVFSVVDQNQTSDAAASGCVGGCCNAGMGCCGAAILCSTPVLPNLGAQLGVISCELRGQAGIEPGTSAKPPRFFA